MLTVAYAFKERISDDRKAFSGLATLRVGQPRPELGDDLLNFLEPIDAEHVGR
jgi:hypothetical protein